MSATEKSIAVMAYEVLIAMKEFEAAEVCVATMTNEELLELLFL
jgi:hypothetical protein